MDFKRYLSNTIVSIILWILMVMFVLAILYAPVANMIISMSGGERIDLNLFTLIMIILAVLAGIIANYVKKHKPIFKHRKKHKKHHYGHNRLKFDTKTMIIIILVIVLLFLLFSKPINNETRGSLDKTIVQPTLCHGDDINKCYGVILPENISENEMLSWCEDIGCHGDGFLGLSTSGPNIQCNCIKE